MSKTDTSRWLTLYKTWAVRSPLGKATHNKPTIHATYVGMAVTGLLMANHAFAGCVSSNGANTNTSPFNDGSYAQNSIITCTDSTTATAINGARAGYGYNTGPYSTNTIAKETSQVLRWTNATAATDMHIDVENGATVTGSGLTKGLLLMHTGYYTTNGNGNSVVASWITPDNHPSMTITNNGAVTYTNNSHIQNTDTNVSAAAVIEADDSPVDQYIINHGRIDSQSAWGALIADLAVSGGPLYTARSLASYQYASGNIVGIENSGTIIQDTGTIKSGSIYSGHSAAVGLMVPLAKEAYIKNTDTGTIIGSENGIDILTYHVSNAHIDNDGSIFGGSNGINLIPIQLNNSTGYTPTLTTLSNTKTGNITGGLNGINNHGTIGTLNNAGTLSGATASIDTASGTVTNGINNYGILNGNVLLGGNTLNVLDSSDAISAHPQVNGNIIGFAASIVNIGTGSGTTLFTTNGDATVGNINVASGNTLALSNGADWAATADTAGNVTNNGTIRLADSAAFSTATLGASGAVINNGVIDLTSNTGTADTLTIAGNYTGHSGTVKMNTVWNAPGDENGADSESDVLNITGTADGSTTVMPIKSDGTANVIDGNVQQVAEVLNTVPVINVGTSGATAFTGTAQTTGATEVQLAKRTNDQGQDEYYWTMAAKQPDSPTQPGNPSQPNTPIYANQIPGYVAMPRVNLEQGYATVGTLHERRGENQTLAWDECGTCGNDAQGQTWARLYGKHLEQDGKSRLNLDTDIFGVQIGHDFLVKRNDNGSHNLTGGYVSYNKADTDFADEYRAENGIISRDKHTGKGKSDALSLGLTNTYYSANGSYLDVVGQVSWLRNRYEARNGTNPDSQNGWGAALSAEVGRPFALGNHTPSEGGWMIEPQAQLVYQYVSLDDFNDGTRHVDQNGQDGLRGRVGVRLAYNAEGKEQQTNTFYTVANIWHDFLNPAAVDIGRDSLREKYASTWAEVGLGVQVPVAKHSYVYGDARYEQELGSTKREGYRGSVGFKYTWK